MTSAHSSFTLRRGRFALIDADGRLRIPAIWIATALSILLHAALLADLLPRPHLGLPSFDNDKAQSSMLRLRVLPRDAATAGRPSSPAPESRQPRIPPSPRTRAQTPPPSPPVVALSKPAPALPNVAPPAPSVPPAPPAPIPAPESQTTAPAQIPARPAAPALDMQASVRARQLARGTGTAPTPTPDNENARRDAIVAGNLGLDRGPTFGRDPRGPGGGVFRLTFEGLDRAEFVFFGWNKNIQRNTAQTIEVRRGSESDIRIAVVRRMITIIREHETGDFEWESRRLGRILTLSARPEDNRGLEEVLMREFYEPRR